MAHVRMHDDEIDTTADLVRHLLTTQQPRWSELPITRVVSAGTDNAIYRVGTELAVRLPRIAWALDAVEKEQRWLPALAPHLPLPVPEIVAVGAPDAARFPYRWSVVRWLHGEPATIDHLGDPVRAARDLATFVRSLRAIDASHGPTHHRGAPVRVQEHMVRDGVAALQTGDGLDGEAILAAWSRASTAPDHDGPPVWFHGDLSSLNLLARDGRLEAVIDWGTCGVGDPAIDLTVAWTLFDAESRRAYRDALDVDDAAWDRGKAWVLTGVYGVGYYRHTNPVLVANIVRGLRAVLAHER